VVTIALEDGTGANVPPGPNDSAEMQKAVLFSELDSRIRAAPELIAERDRAIFWLYYLQGLTAEEIAGLPAIELSAKGVESVLRRVITWLRKELESRKPDGPAQAVQEPG
ncbi:MAG: hypothetical protein WAM85_02680, partial [Terracidiphilus sp.]